MSKSVREGTKLFACGGCSSEIMATRIPPGWKNRGDYYLCRQCLRQKFVLRAITVPVASPLNCDWKDLHDVLAQRWADTTNAANWMMTELYVRDCRRNGDVKMPKMVHQDLYLEARERFPNLPSQSVSSLQQAIQKKYRAKRYEVVWTSAASLPSHRYPVPFPVHNQSWEIEFDDDKPVLSAKIASGTSPRCRLRLKGGPRYRRQLAAIRQMDSGAAIRGEMAIMRRKDHETGRSDILCKMVAWFPRSEKAANGSGILFVGTREDSLLVALNVKDERLWKYNGDHLPRWTSEHARRLQRWAEDSKFENRPVPSFSGRRSAAVEKYKNRMSSACHEIAAQVVGYAKRRRFAEIHYKDSEQGFCLQFPYFRLRKLIAEKADAAGIVFEHHDASDEAPNESGSPLAERKGVEK